MSLLNLRIRILGCRCSAAALREEIWRPFCFSIFKKARIAKAAPRSCTTIPRCCSISYSHFEFLHQLSAPSPSEPLLPQMQQTAAARSTCSRRRRKQIARSASAAVTCSPAGGNSQAPSLLPDVAQEGRKVAARARRCYIFGIVRRQSEARMLRGENMVAWCGGGGRGAAACERLKGPRLAFAHCLGQSCAVGG